MPSTRSSTKPILVLGIGVLLLGAGIGLASLGYTQFDKCGAQEISVSTVPPEAVDNPERYTPFESLTADQQASFERALESGEAYLYNQSAFPHIAYQGSHFTARGSVVVCDFSPTTFMALGGATAIFGGLLLGWLSNRRFGWLSAEEN